jgi:hypothetical protein
MEAQKEAPMAKFKPAVARKTVVFIVVVIGALVSFAGGGRARQAALEAQLGSRFLTTLPQVMKAGSSAEAVIVDPGKLAQFGLANLKKGDRIRLIKGSGESDFTVEVTQRVNFTIDEKGALRRLER